VTAAVATAAAEAATAGALWLCPLTALNPLSSRGPHGSCSAARSVQTAWPRAHVAPPSPRAAALGRLLLRGGLPRHHHRAVAKGRVPPSARARRLCAGAGSAQWPYRAGSWAQASSLCGGTQGGASAAPACGVPGRQGHVPTCVSVPGRCTMKRAGVGCCAAGLQVLAAPQAEAKEIVRRRFPVPKIVDCDHNGSQARPMAQGTPRWRAPPARRTSNGRALPMVHCLRLELQRAASESELWSLSCRRRASCSSSSTPPPRTRPRRQCRPR
jgi:hypothetical protein